jgi:hypothetical protein
MHCHLIMQAWFDTTHGRRGPLLLRFTQTAFSSSHLASQTKRGAFRKRPLQALSAEYLPNLKELFLAENHVRWMGPNERLPPPPLLCFYRRNFGAAAAAAATTWLVHRRPRLSHSRCCPLSAVYRRRGTLLCWSVPPPALSPLLRSKRVVGSPLSQPPLPSLTSVQTSSK